MFTIIIYAASGSIAAGVGIYLVKLRKVYAQAKAFVERMDNHVDYGVAHFDQTVKDEVAKLRAVL